MLNLGFEGIGDFFEGGDSNVDVAPFDAADGADGQTGGLGQVALEPFPFFSQDSDPFADLLVDFRHIQKSRKDTYVLSTC